MALLCFMWNDPAQTQFCYGCNCSHISLRISLQDIFEVYISGNIHKVAPTDINGIVRH